jgi:hypothetical protein
MNSLLQPVGTNNIQAKSEMESAMESEVSRKTIDAMFEFQKELFVLCDKLRKLDAAQKRWGQFTRTEQNASLGTSGVSEEGQGAPALPVKDGALPANQLPVPRSTHWLWAYFRPRARSN